MDLIDFIIEAKKAGYAGSGKELNFEDGSKGFQYDKEGLKYLDRFYGFNPFSGTELVFCGKNPVWIMNYYGKVDAEGDKAKNIYSFLRSAMAAIDRNYPFRGPEKMNKDGLIYKNIQNGSFENFLGEETISEDDMIIYKLHYHGGAL